MKVKLFGGPEGGKTYTIGKTTRKAGVFFFIPNGSGGLVAYRIDNNRAVYAGFSTAGK